MKEILLLKTNKTENRNKIIRELIKIKPLKKVLQRYEVSPGVFSHIPIEKLEKFLHELNKRYGYKIQWVTPVYVDGGFLHYTTSILDEHNKYVEAVTDVKMFGLLSKAIIVMWDEIKREREKIE